MTHAAIRSAAGELTTLVTAMRDDWAPDEVSRVLASVHSMGWLFTQAVIELVGLAVIEGAEPGDLLSGKSGKRKGASFAAVRRATDELVALVVKMREDWPEWAEGKVRRELAACYGSGWPDARVVLELVRLAVIGDGEPRDLTAAALSPYSRRTLGDRRG